MDGPSVNLGSATPPATDLACGRDALRSSEEASVRKTARRRRRAGSATPTIADVAELANVSTATVSRVLAGNYPVAVETQERVQAAIAELDYSANPHARGLSGGSPAPVAVLLRDITGPSFTSLVRGVEKQSAKHGRLCIIGTTDASAEAEAAQVELMRGQRVAALILLGGVPDMEEYRDRMARYARLLASHGGSLVLCGRPPLPHPEPNVIEIAYDNTAATYELGRRLLENGHREILAVAGALDSTTAQARLAGYQRAVAEVPEARLHVRWAGFEREACRVAVSAAIEDGTRFTAVVTGSDIAATGALAALREHGLSCPVDVSVTGFDDIPLAEDLSPTLTTVHVPYEEMGRLAVELALSEVEGPRRELLPVETRWRASTAAAPEVS